MYNRTQDFYVALSFIFGGIILSLIMVLFWEYRFFCHQSQELEVIKQHYYTCIGELQKKLEYEQKVNFINGEQQEVNGKFVSVGENLVGENNDIVQNEAQMEKYTPVINGQSDCVKESVLNYLKDEELDSLMTTIDTERWSDYAEQDFVVSQTIKRPQKQKRVISARPAKKELGLMLPIAEGMFWLSSLFGPRKRINGTWGFHYGIDMAAAKGTVVKAARRGIVIEVGFQKGYGNTVVIQHSTILKTRYAHLQSICVYKGQSVKQGSYIGTVGDTGFVRRTGKDGSHLHFEVYERGVRINPLHCLPRIT